MKWLLICLLALVPLARAEDVEEARAREFAAQREWMIRSGELVIPLPIEERERVDRVEAIARLVFFVAASAADQANVGNRAHLLAAAQLADTLQPQENPSLDALAQALREAGIGDFALGKGSLYIVGGGLTLIDGNANHLDLTQSANKQAAARGIFSGVLIAVAVSHDDTLRAIIREQFEGAIP